MDRAGRASLCSLVRWVHAVPAVVAVVLTVLVLPWSLTRDVEFRVHVQQAGSAWRIDWGRGPGTDRNGHWIDLAEVRARAEPTSSSGKPLVFRVRLPSYAVEDIGLRWDDSPGACLRLESVAVEDRVLGIAFPRQQLQLAHVEGGAGDPSPALPMEVACSAAGGVFFSCPAPPARWVLVLPAAVLAVGLTWIGACGLWRLAGVFEARRPTIAHRTHGRWWGFIAVAVILGVPIWMGSWAPMIVSGDGIQYMQLAISIARTHSLAGFDGWRLPGYPVVMLPFLASMADFVRGIGWAQTAMAVGASLLTWDLLRRRVRAPWHHVGAILVAIDPALVMWQRTVLTEQQTTLMVALGAWLFVRAADQLGRTGGTGRALLWALALGAALGAACSTRPNLQVMALLMPLALAVQAWRSKARVGALAGAVALLVSAAVVSPLIVHNARTFSRPSLVIGSDWNRAVWAWEDGLMDWNQSGVFTFDQFRELRARCEQGRVLSFTFPDLAQAWGTPAAPSGAHPVTQRDIRAGALWRESAARRGDLFLVMVPRAFASLMGVPMRTPPIFHNDARFLLSPILGDAGQCPDGTNWLTGSDHQEEPRLAPTVHPIGNLASTRCAGVFGAWFDGWAIVRPAIAAVFVLALVVLLRRDDWPFAALGIILVAHMAGVAVIVFCGNDRYAMPWYGLMTAVMLVGLVGRPDQRAIPPACGAAGPR